MDGNYIFRQIHTVEKNATSYVVDDLVFAYLQNMDLGNTWSLLFDKIEDSLYFSIYRKINKVIQEYVWDRHP
jgi:hypothetical protein